MTFSFTIPRTDFLAAVERAEKVVGKSQTPIANNLMVALAEDGTMTVTGTDLQRKAVATAATTHHIASGATTVSATHLAATLRRAKGDTVKVVVADKEARIQVGRSNLKMPTLSASDFPDIEKGAPAAAATFSLTGEALGRIVKACAFAMEKNTARPYLMGVHVAVAGDRLMAAGTDGKRVARLVMDAPAGAADMPSVTLPDVLVGVLGLFAKADNVAVSVSSALVHFEIPGLALASRLIDDTFPDINRYLPARRSTSATVDRDGLLEAIRLVEAFAGQANRDIALVFTPTGLRVLAASSGAGEASDEMSADGNCDLTIGFKSEFLASSLASFDGSAVEFDLGSEQEPAVIYDPEDAGRLVMILPFALTPAIMEAVRTAA